MNATAHATSLWVAALSSTFLLVVWVALTNRLTTGRDPMLKLAMAVLLGGLVMLTGTEYFICLTRPSEMVVSTDGVIAAYMFKIQIARWSAALVKLGFAAFGIWAYTCHSSDAALPLYTHASTGLPTVAYTRACTDAVLGRDVDSCQAAVG